MLCSAWRTVCAASILLLLPAAAAQKEFLTPKEIERIQDEQEIDKRVKIYLEVAALRLKSADERLNGQEPEAGDPMEFFTAEDMLDGYFRILKSVMLNIDGANNSKTEPAKITRALQDLKSSTEKASKQLQALKKTAEEKKLEKLWNLVNQAIDINQGANEGATTALADRPAPNDKRQNKKF
jgi:hypothetical protein